MNSAFELLEGLRFVHNCRVQHIATSRIYVTSREGLSHNLHCTPFKPRLSTIYLATTLKGNSIWPCSSPAALPSHCLLVVPQQREAVAAGGGLSARCPGPLRFKQDSTSLDSQNDEIPGPPDSGYVLVKCIQPPEKGGSGKGRRCQHYQFCAR